MQPLSIGIMQGRLLPMIDGRVQSFPRDGWEKEFPLAQKQGFASIELTIEMASWEIHPVRSSKGRALLKNLANEHNITLAGLCCDTVMEHPLTKGGQIAENMLFTLLENGAEAGLPMIELPMLGSNSLAKAEDISIFNDLLAKGLEFAADFGIDILLECDLDGPSLAALMQRQNHPRLGINYDMGNSHYFGFEPEDEIPAYFKYIRNAHVKDTTKAEYSKPLGQGETRLNDVFRLLARHNYRGGFILQAARQEDDIKAAKEYLEFTQNLIDKNFV